MKKILLTIALFGCMAGLRAEAQFPVTPHYGFCQPPQGASGWAPCYNSNFDTLDSTLWALSTPYQGTWSGTTTYSSGQFVTYSGTVYVSTVNPNTNHIPGASSQWQVITGSGGTPGGSNYAIQYGNGGAFAGASLSGIVVGSTVGAPRIANAGDIIALFASGACAGYMRGDNTCPTIIPLATAATMLNAASALPNGTTGTTQAMGDGSTQLATDAFVLANAGGSGGSTANPLTAATTGGAAPGTTFNGSAPVILDYHSLGAAAANAGGVINGVTFTLGSSISTPSTCGGSGGNCPYQQVNPTTGGGFTTTTAAITNSALTVPVTSCSGFTFAPGSYIAFNDISSIEWTVGVSCTGTTLTLGARGAYYTAGDTTLGASAWPSGTNVVQMTVGQSLSAVHPPISYTLANGAQVYGPYESIVPNQVTFGNPIYSLNYFYGAGVNALAGGTNTTYSPQATFTEPTQFITTCATSGYLHYINAASYGAFVGTSGPTYLCPGATKLPANVWAIVPGASVGAAPVPASAVPAMTVSLGGTNPPGYVNVPAGGSYNINGVPITGGGGGFPITLGSTSIAASSTTAAVTGLAVNGVNLSAGGASNLYLDETGTYSTPAGGAAVSSITTTGSSGPATLASGVLNIPVYVAPTSAYLALNPALGDGQTVTMQQGDGTIFSENSTGTVSSTINPVSILMNSFGPGNNSGNNGTSQSGWTTQNGLTLNLHSATPGIMQGITENIEKDAGGDFAGLYMYAEAFGGGTDASGEGVQGATFQVLQRPWFNGAVVVPSIGVINRNPQTILSTNTTYIWTGGDSAPITFQSSGNLQSFSVDFYNGSVAATGYLVVVTPLGGNQFTFGTPIAVSVPALSSVGGGSFANVVTYTSSSFGTVPIIGGQTLAFYPGAANAPSGSSFGGMSVAGPPSAGTVTATSSTGMQIFGSLAPPTQGANSLTTASMNCNVNCTNPRLSQNFPVQGYLLNTSEATTTAVLGAQSSVLGAITYALTSGTVPVSTAWGNIISSSCSPNSTNEFQALASVTCNVTLGVSPATPGNFVASGGLTSCSQVAVSPGTALDAMLSGPYAEEVYILSVGTPSAGVQPVTFCSTRAWNAGSPFIAQGGPVSRSMVATSVLGYWPVAYPLVAGFTSTQVAISNCWGGNCNAGGHNTLAATTPVTILSSAMINGSGNGTLNTAQIGTNFAPVAVGDNIVGAPTSEIGLDGIRIVCGQWSPIDYSTPGTCGVQVTDQGGSPMPYMFRVANAASSANPAVAMFNVDTGFWEDTFHMAAAPTRDLFYIGTHSSTTTGIFEVNDSYGKLSFIDTGGAFNQEILNWSESFNAVAYEANGSFGTAGQCLITGGTTSPASWGACGTGGVSTATNCASSASPAVCGSAASGSVVVAAASSTVVVNTTAVTANSQIQITPDSSLGARLGVTCNTTASLPSVSARTAGSSFTLATPTPTANPECFNYTIVN